MVGKTSLILITCNVKRANIVNVTLKNLKLILKIQDSNLGVLEENVCLKDGETDAQHGDPAERAAVTVALLPVDVVLELE